MESYSVGTNILIKDLKSGEKYNGQHGTIIEPFDTEKGRYSVQLINSEKKLSVRPVNISVLAKEMDLNTNTKDELSTETAKNEPIRNVNENDIPDVVPQEETKCAEVSSETKSSTMMESIAPYSDQAITESVENQSAQAIIEPVGTQSSQAATESTESKSSVTIIQQGSQSNQSSLNFPHHSSNVQDEKQSQAPNPTSWDGNQAHQPRGKGSKSSNRSRRPRSYSHFPRGRQYRTSSHRSHRSRPPYFSRGRGRRPPRSSPPYPAYGSPYAPYYPTQSFPYPPGQLPQGQVFQRPGNGLWLPPRGVTSGPNPKNTSPPVRRTPCVLEIIDPETSEPIKFAKAATAPKKTNDSVFSQKGSHRLPILDESRKGPEITEQFFNTQMSIGPIMPPILPSPILPCPQNSRPVLSYDTLPTVSYQPEPEKFLATSRQLAGTNFQNQLKPNSLLTGLVVQKKKTAQQPEGILKDQGGGTPINAMGNTKSSQPLPESKHVKPSQKRAALNVPYVESTQKMAIATSAPQQATSIPPTNSIPTENRTPPPKPMWGDDDDDDNRSRSTTLTWNDIAARRAKEGQIAARNTQTIAAQKQTNLSERRGPSQIHAGNRQVLSQQSRPAVFGSSQLNIKSVEQPKSQKESKGQPPVSRWGTNVQSQSLLPPTNNTTVNTNQAQPMRKAEGLKDIMQKESARMTKPKIKSAWGDDNNESKPPRKLTERQMEQQRQMEKARLMQADRENRQKTVKKKNYDKNKKIGQVEGNIKGGQDRGVDMQRNEKMDPPQDRRRFQDLGRERNQFQNRGMFGRSRRVEVEPGSRPPWKAFIGNLPFNCIESEIKGFLRVDVAKIKHIEIICDDMGDSKGFAYVEFIDRDTLLRALEQDGAGLGHRRIRVDFAGDRNRARNNRASRFDDRERNNRDRMSNYPRSRFGGRVERNYGDDWRRDNEDWGRRDRESDRKRNAFSDRPRQERIPRRRGRNAREDDWANDERKPLELSKKVVTEEKSERSSIFGVGKRREDILASRSRNENMDKKIERHEEDEGYRECDAPKKDNRAKESGKEEHSMEDINSQKHLKEDRAKKSKPKKLKKDGKKKAPTNRFDALSVSDDDA